MRKVVSDFFDFYNHRDEIGEKIANMDSINLRVCCFCHTPKQKSQFYKNVSKTDFNSGYSIFCRPCCARMFKKYLTDTKSLGAAFWLLLAKIDLPFYYDLWKPVKDAYDLFMSDRKRGNDPDWFGMYLQALYDSEGYKTDGFYNSDTMIDVLYTLQINDEDTEGLLRTKDFNLSSQQGLWGRYIDEQGRPDLEAYEFLNKEYRQYTKDLGEINTNLENRYRDLCRCELRLRRANEKGDGQEISRAQESLSKQLSLLKLNDFQSNNVSEEEKFIERQIWMIENTKPAECEDLNKYKDYSKMTGEWEEIMRTTNNLVAGTREYPDLPKNAS